MLHVIESWYSSKVSGEMAVLDFGTGMVDSGRALVANIVTCAGGDMGSISIR